MKKTLLTSIIALAAIVAMPAAAQTTNGSTGATKTEQAGKESKKERHNRVTPDGKQRHQARTDAFEGITLSDTQKEALKALRPQRPEQKKDGEKRDSVTPRHNREKMRADFVNGVKGILTPEQYVIFLENIVIRDAKIPGAGQDMHKGGMPKGEKGKMHQGGKGPKRDAKGPRDGKTPRRDKQPQN